MKGSVWRQIGRMVGRNALFMLVGVAVFALFDWISKNRTLWDFLRFLPVLLVAECVICAWYALRFLRMIRRQQLLGFEFSDEGFEPLQRRSSYGVAGEWFIRSGIFALHRQAIRDVSLRRVYRKTSYRFRFTVHTSDGRKYRLEFYRKEDASRFLKWSGFAGRSGEDEELL